MAIRDFRRRWFEALLMTVVLALSATVLTAGLALRNINNDPYLRTKDATNGPDVVAELPPPFLTGESGNIADPAQLAALQRAPGITKTSGPYPVLHSSLSWHGRAADTLVIGRDANSASLDQPKVTNGHWLSSGSAVVEKAFADSLHLRVGQTITVDNHHFRIGGFAVTTAIHAYPQSSQLAWWTTQSPGVIWLDRFDQASLITPSTELGYLLNLRLVDSNATNAFISAHAEPPSSGGVQLYSWQSIATSDNQTIESERQALMFGATFLSILALASVVLVAGRRMSEQTRRVGLLKAVGATPAFVTSVLLTQNALIALSGSLIGLGAGYWLTGPLSNAGASLIGCAGKQSITPTTALAVFAVAFAVTIIATVLPAIKASSTPTAEALRDASKQPRRYGRLSDIATHLPIPMLIGLRTATRRMRRSMLNASGVGVTVVGIVVVLATHTFYAKFLDGGSDIPNPWTGRINEMIVGITVLMAIITSVNLIFVTWATVVDNRRQSALHRALGATPAQVAWGLALAQLGPAIIGTGVGIPAGLLLNKLLRHGVMTVPPTLTLVAVIVGTPAVVLMLALGPARAGANRMPGPVLQSEST